ncbi:M23 family metallopeptidase [Streptomyces sp. NPDC048111]|uniref:M23 family metallopeptidase n=1 Tax=Streptomyces sp. NPDC048111 TaxID=3365500 RepID=UPI00371A7ACC
MTDQHAHAGFVGHDGYLNGSSGHDGGGPAQHTGSFAVDPLFGAMQDEHAAHGPHGNHAAGTSGQFDTGVFAAPQDTASYDTAAYHTAAHSTGQWTVPAQATAYEPDGATGTIDTGQFATGQFGAGAFHSTGQFDTGQFTTGHADTGTFATGTFATGQFSTAPFSTGQFSTGQFSTGQFSTAPFTANHDTGSFDTTGQGDANAWNQAQGTGQFDSSAFGSAPGAHQAHDAYDATGQWAVPGAQFETGTFDATAWNAVGHAETAVPHLPTDAQPPADPRSATVLAAHEPEPQLPHETTEFELIDLASEPSADTDTGTGTSTSTSTGSDRGPDLGPTPLPASRADARRAANRRRRMPAKRSALLTVAVPSACVMGVAGVAVASVSGLTDGKDAAGTVAAASDPASVKPVAANTKLDTQLANLSADASSFADRASRTQERIDLKARQDAEKKKKADAAAAKEAARPKFLLPVTQKGLSAYYGQAGVNWMSVHTGIDFPVSYGTPVMSAIDGTIRTQWNSAYGNMAIVTGADGTETWYCHLSSTKIRSGPVKAGDLIAYSGNSGNSTGPHLHFEVHPHGGTSVDPLPWLRGHGLDPT